MDNCITKICTLCESEKPATLEYFARHKNGKYGLQARCRVCHNAVVREYKQRPEQREKDKLRKKQPKYKEWEAEYRKQPAYKKWQKKYACEWAKQFRKDYPEKVKAAGHKFRARRRQATGTFTKEDVSIMMQSQKGLCWWCSKKLNGKYHIDHRIALSRGGSNWPSNLCLTCPTCNYSKNDRMPWEWSGRLV